MAHCWRWLATKQDGEARKTSTKRSVYIHATAVSHLRSQNKIYEIRSEDKTTHMYSIRARCPR